MKSRDTRQNILNAAQRLITTGGFMRLTTKEIAREAGCAEGTLFKYFAKKEDLCLAVVLENSPRFRERIAEMSPGTSTVSKNLEGAAVAAIQFFAKLIPLSVSLFADTSLLRRHREAMRRNGRGPADVFEAIAIYIRAEQKLHRIAPAAKPAAAAALLLGPCFQRAFIKEVTGKHVPPSTDRNFAAALVAALMSGLQPKNYSSSSSAASTSGLA